MASDTALQAQPAEPTDPLKTQIAALHSSTASAALLAAG